MSNTEPPEQSPMLYCLPSPTSPALPTELIRKGRSGSSLATLHHADISKDSAMSWNAEDFINETLVDASLCTVSPKDLFRDTTSVPSSASTTALETPMSTMIDTPQLDSNLTSPLFDDALQLDCSTVDWYSLFPVEGNDLFAQSELMASSASAQGHVIVHPGGESRRPRRAKTLPITSLTRHSSIAGITKYEKVLPPIVVDEQDIVGLKRARNTAAARKSRDKKFKEKELMETRIRDLEREVEHWKAVALAANPEAVLGS